MSKINIIFLFYILVFISFVAPSYATTSNVYFDIVARKKQLQTLEYSQIKQYCMALELSQPVERIPTPVMALKKTKGYGSDRKLSEFTWFVMVNGGRALAGDTNSIQKLKQAFLVWARANALSKTEEVHDAYYALKRGLLPIIVNYAIIRGKYTRVERNEIDRWLDGLVSSVDKKFNGDVDLNNHRYLADSVLAAWGQLKGDKYLYNKGLFRFKEALMQMLSDGSLPLETRRGARALWYMRQSLASLTVIAEIYAQNNNNLYDLNVDGKNLSDMMDYYLSSISNPLLVLSKAAQNHIAGPSDDFMNQDMGMLERRGGRRHYMAFSEAYINHYKNNNVASVRLENLMDRTGFKERPLIDDFVGGNATCFWGYP